MDVPAFAEEADDANRRSVRFIACQTLVDDNAQACGCVGARVCMSEVAMTAAMHREPDRDWWVVVSDQDMSGNGIAVFYMRVYLKALASSSTRTSREWKTTAYVQSVHKSASHQSQRDTLAHAPF